MLGRKRQPTGRVHRAQVRLRHFFDNKDRVPFESLLMLVTTCVGPHTMARQHSVALAHTAHTHGAPIVTGSHYPHKLPDFVHLQASQWHDALPSALCPLLLPGDPPAPVR